MNEVEKVFHDLTQLLDSFLQGLVQCNLVSGYSLSLTTYPESFTSSNKTLPFMFVSLLQQLQDGIKKLLILCNNKERQDKSWKLVQEEHAAVQESSTGNCEIYSVEEKSKMRYTHKDRELCVNRKENPIREKDKSPSDVMDTDNENQNSEHSSHDDISKVDTSEPKTRKDCMEKTEDIVQREEDSSEQEQQFVIVDDEVQVMMEDGEQDQSQTSVQEEVETQVVVQDDVQEEGTAVIESPVVSQLNDLDEESIEVPEPAENKIINEKEEDKIQFKCSECHREFKSASTLETHRMKFHTPPQCCDMCGQILGSTAALQEHCRTVHDGAGCFQCSMCKRRFMLRLSFRRHLETHEPATTMAVCEICGKSFRRADYLQRHYLSHTGQRPHVCNICGKSFLCTSHLKNHMTALHNTESYPCNLCGRNFARPDKLKEHRLRHFNIKRHACIDCGKEYAERRDLKKHMKRCAKVVSAN